ncbi:unnamed protein product [Camellia sinensis]
MKERKSVKFNLQQQQQHHHHQNGHLSPFKFAKLLDPEASWDKRSIRGCTALDSTSGGPCMWVALGYNSFSWRHMDYCKFLVISSGIIYGYYAMILKIDEEDFGGHGALLQEGLFVSIMLSCMDSCIQLGALLIGGFPTLHSLFSLLSRRVIVKLSIDRLYKASPYCPDNNILESHYMEIVKISIFIFMVVQCSSAMHGT